MTVKLLRLRQARGMAAYRRVQLQEWARTIRGQLRAYVYWEKAKEKQARIYAKGGLEALIQMIELETGSDREEQV